MANKNLVEFKGTVVRCIYNSNNLKVYALDVDTEKYSNIVKNKYNNVSISGRMPELKEGHQYEITAKVEEGKYGTEYKVRTIGQDTKMEGGDVLVFLRSCIAPSRASILYKAYPDILERIKNNNLSDIDTSAMHGYGQITLNRDIAKLKRNMPKYDVIKTYGDALSFSEIDKLIAKFGFIDSIRDKLNNRPYEALTSINGIGFKKADDIVLRLNEHGLIGTREDILCSAERCYAVLKYLLEENEKDGNTIANVVDIRKQCIELVGKAVLHFEEVVKDETFYYDADTLRIALVKTHENEEHIAKRIVCGVKNKNIWSIDCSKYKVIDELELTQDQLNVLPMVCENNVSMLIGYAGCVDCDTEFFNGKEWKRIADYKDGDMVLQYNENGTAELVKPTSYIKHPSDYLWHFQTKYGLDQCLSDDHNVYYVTSKGNLYHKTFREVRKDQENKGFHGKFITTFDYSGKGIELTDDEIRLMIATFADGTFFKKYDNKPDSKLYTQARFHIKKDRKKERLLLLAKETVCEYRVSSSVAEGYDDIYINVPFRAKHFPAEWYNCSKHQLEVIASEVMFWDGYYKKNNGYSTTSKEDADFIQFVFSALGYRATIFVDDRAGTNYLTNNKVYKRKSVTYVVRFTNKTLIGMSHDKRRENGYTKINEYKTLDGYQYCFTVPSHMLVLRRNNKIFITGNSGKTTSMKALIKMLDDNELTYMLLAPTGRAAKVLEETTGKEAKTIHRGLGLIPKKYICEFNIDNPLTCDIVIVDEFSMVDVSLMRHLIDAVDFTKTKLLMVGDAAQAASVGAGSVFDDIVNSNVVPYIMLDKIFRYTSNGLIKVATDVRNNEVYLKDSKYSKVSVFGDDKDYVFINSDNDHIVADVMNVYKQLINNRCNPKDIRVLTAYNIGEFGSIAFNNHIQKAANPKKEFAPYIETGDKNGTRFYENDIVIQKKNNYKARVYNEYGNEGFVANGDVGKVVKICGGYVVIDFDNIKVEYSQKDMEDVQLAYCTSIHSSQGGSIKYPIVVTPRSHTYFLNSNLLYVALTRTTKRCYHVGSKKTVNIAVKKSEIRERNTALCDLLKQTAICVDNVE